MGPVQLAALLLVPCVSGCSPTLIAAAGIWTVGFAIDLLTLPLRSLLGTMFLHFITNTNLTPG